MLDESKNKHFKVYCEHWDIPYFTDIDDLMKWLKEK